MSLNNIIQISPSSVPPAGLNLICDGIRVEKTTKTGNLLVVNESTFFNNISVYAQLQRNYNDLQVDGNFICSGITGSTGSFNNITAINANLDHINCIDIKASAGITAASLNASSVTGVNSSFSGVSVSGSIISGSALISGGLTCNQSLTCGQTATCLNLKVNNSANITNNISCGQTITCQNSHVLSDIQCDNTITCQNLYVNSTSNSEFEYIGKKFVVPRLNTGDRDSIGGDDGCILYNTDLNNLQTFRSGLWETISYYPQIMQMYLISDESISNASLHLCGSSSNLAEVFNSNPNYQFDYDDIGVFRLNVAGIYKVSCTIALQPPTTDFHSLQLYIYFGKSDQSQMYGEYFGLTDNVGPYHYPNKEMKYQFSTTVYIDSPDKYSFFIYQENDTTSNFNLITSPYAPYTSGTYNNLFTIQYLSPKF